MRELQLLPEVDFITFAGAESRGAPFAHAIEGQYRRGIERAGEESAGGMALVVIGENEMGLGSGFEVLPQSAPREELVLKPDGHRKPKAFEPGGRVTQIGFEKPIKLREGLVVERDVVKLLG